MDTTTDYTSWSLDALTDYIVKKHHSYAEQQALEIKPYLQKIAQVHGDRHPELLEVEKLFKESVGELAKHMKKEELMIFPQIRKLAIAERENQAPQLPPNAKVADAIRSLMKDHDIQDERFKRIAELTNDYTPPSDGCNTYRVTLSMLKEYEDDLHLHLDLENNIVFPKSIKLEEQLAAAV